MIYIAGVVQTRARGVYVYIRMYVAAVRLHRWKIKRLVGRVRVYRISKLEIRGGPRLVAGSGHVSVIKELLAEYSILRTSCVR